MTGFATLVAGITSTFYEIQVPGIQLSYSGFPVTKVLPVGYRTAERIFFFFQSPESIN